jgi:hypothetical protein
VRVSLKGMLTQYGSTGTGTVSPQDGLDKRTLLRLHTPILYILSGDKDVAYRIGGGDFQQITHVPAAVGNLAVGHECTPALFR